MIGVRLLEDRKILAKNDTFSLSASGTGGLVLLARTIVVILCLQLREAHMALG